MNWCCFCFFLCFRCLNYLISHIVWILTIYYGCLYFIFWKSYDILWLWAHLILCALIPKLRADNIFLVACQLVKKRLQFPSKSARELFKEEWCRQEGRDADAITESPTRNRDPSSQRLASAVSLALFILRIFVSAAIFLGAYIPLQYTLPYACHCF